MEHPVPRFEPPLSCQFMPVRPPSLTALLALVLLLSLPISLAAQARSGSACDGAGTIGETAFTGLPQGGNDPSDLLSFRMSSSRKPDGSIAPGTLWLCKPVDSNSTGLLLAALTGNPVASIRLEIAKPNPTTASVVIVLKNVLVTSFSLASSLDRPLEEIELLSCDVEITINPEEGPPRTFFQRCGPPGT
ncbi:MAG TPA: type VI secretion system tube protein Hcp [Candidatus Dormibacteraeota bacterium]|nr:type VI secretion system tube protein Hcp [Candidatus Dormibacteraeota bacterium]